MFGGESVTGVAASGLGAEAATLWGVETVSARPPALDGFMSALGHLPAGSDVGALFYRHPRGAAIISVRRKRATGDHHGAFIQVNYPLQTDLAVTLACVGVRNPTWLVSGIRARGRDTFLVAAEGVLRVEISAPSNGPEGPLDADDYLAQHLTAVGRGAVLTRMAGGDDRTAPPILTRVAVKVRDVSGAEQFFSDGLGFHPVRTHPQGVLVSNGFQEIDLVRTRRREGGLAGLDFYVDSPARLARLARLSPPAAAHNRPHSVQVEGPERLRITLHQGDGSDRDTLLREAAAHHSTR